MSQRRSTIGKPAMPVTTSIGKGRYYYERVRHYVIYDILHANDTPHRLAFGVAIGMFVAMTPTIPFQMILTVFFSWLLRANKVVGLPVVWITNPATVVPIYLPLYVFGCYVMGRSPGENIDFHVLVEQEENFWLYAIKAWEFMEGIFAPLWLGSLIVATVLGVVSYYLTRALVIRYRLKRYGSIHVPNT